MTLDERQARIVEEEDQWRTERDAERATRETARTKGLMVMLDIGWSVYSRTEGEPDEFIVDDYGDAVGGVVLEVGSKVTEYDEDTAEVTRVRSFTTIDPMSLRHHNLTEKQVDPDKILLPDAALTHRVIGRIARLLCSEHCKTRSLLADEDRRLAHCATIWRLAASLRRGMGT